MAEAITLQNETANLINREKLLHGTLYGVVAGLSLALALWARDGSVLQASHALFPWLNLIVGILLFGSIGGLTGHLSTRLDRIWFNLLAWVVASAFFAFLTVSIPLIVFPVLVKWFNPEVGSWLHYTALGGNEARFWIAFMWIAFFFSAAGVLQSTLVETSVFSAAIFGRVAPFLLCAILGIFSGAMLDDLVNAPMRSAVVAVEAPIEFLVANQGKPIDSATSRQQHTSAFKPTMDLVTSQHRLIVSNFDQSLTQVEVAVKFDQSLVTCTTVFGQISYCWLPEE